MEPGDHHDSEPTEVHRLNRQVSLKC
jgi:hypothetical protein